MIENHEREQLLGYLDREAFEPVLKASPDDYASERQKEKLRDVQQLIRSTQQRYHKDYTSAGEVVHHFRRDLTSEATQQVHEDLHSLGLPALPDVKYGFNTLARKLGVKEKANVSL
jgi:transposase